MIQARMTSKQIAAWWLISSSHTISYLVWLICWSMPAPNQELRRILLDWLELSLSLAKGDKQSPVLGVFIQEFSQECCFLLPDVMAESCHKAITTYTMIKTKAITLHLTNGSIFPVHLDTFFHFLFTSLSPKQYKQGTALQCLQVQTRPVLDSL